MKTKEKKKIQKRNLHDLLTDERKPYEKPTLKRRVAEALREDPQDIEKKLRTGLEKVFGEPVIVHEITERDLVQIMGGGRRNRKQRQPTLSRVRVTLNRPLTAAHIEDITHRGFHFRVTVDDKDKARFWVEGPMSSREMTKLIEEHLAKRYANYFVMHFWTTSEYSGANWPQLRNR